MGKSIDRSDTKSDRPLIHLSAIALYALVAVVSTWPLFPYRTTRLPIGTEEARTVPMFNTWTIWWNADRLAHGGRGYWDAPIFYPHRNTFAFSEPQPLTMCVAPVVWLTGSRVLASNLYLWISLILNGWLTQLLLRYLGLRLPIAIGAGVAMVLLPIVHWQMGVLQLVPLWAILWTWQAFAKLATPQTAPKSAKEARWRGSELGLAFTAAMFSSVHHALFLAVLMLAGAWTLGRKAWNGRVLWALSTAVLLAAVLCSPIILHLREMTSQHGFARTREVVEQLSLRISDYGTVYGHTCIRAQASDQTQTWLVSVGWIKLFWAALGVYFGMFVDRQRKWTFFLLTVGVLSFALSLGTNLELAGWQPWQLLINYVPGFAQVRSAFRFAYFVHVAVVLAAAQGIDAMWSRLGSWLQLRTGAVWLRLGRGCAVIAVIALSVLAAVDPWPPVLRLGVVPDAPAHRDWIDALKTSPQPGAVLCLPMAGGDHVRDFEITTEWMLLGTFHGRPLVNGFSGFFPTDYLKLREETWSGQLPDMRLEELYKEGVRFVIVDRRRYDVPWHDEGRIGPITAKRLLQNAAGIDLYQLRSAAP